tara:strand:- start:3246 stop:4238 length:993 start_codon:yes stop_codon:yes gene_type:complete
MPYQYQKDKWVRVKLDPKTLKKCMTRNNVRPLFDMLSWLALMGFFAWLSVIYWGSALGFFCLFCYGILYGSGSSAREHETGHGTAFKSKALNRLFHEISSFCILRETFLRNHGHDLHHRHTIVTGVDPEIVTPTPPNLFQMVVNLFQIEKSLRGFRPLTAHSFGYLLASEVAAGLVLKRRTIWLARLWLFILGSTVAAAYFTQSILPLLFIGPLPAMYGGTLRHLFSLSQHVGLATDVNDHRLNTRTIILGPVLSYIYLNMNYHLEHHLYPSVPYYHLPRLCRELAPQCPPPYRGLISVFVELIPVLLKQRQNPHYHIKRSVPRYASPSA